MRAKIYSGALMPKIRVEVVAFEDGVYLFHPKTKLVFEYSSPHRVVGKIEPEGFTFIKSARPAVSKLY